MTLTVKLKGKSSIKYSTHDNDFDKDCTFEVPAHKADSVERDILADDHIIRYRFWKEITCFGMKTTYIFKIKYGKYAPRKK